MDSFIGWSLLLLPVWYWVGCCIYKIGYERGKKAQTINIVNIAGTYISHANYWEDRGRLAEQKMDMIVSGLSRRGSELALFAQAIRDYISPVEQEKRKTWQVGEERNK